MRLQLNPFAVVIRISAITIVLSHGAFAAPVAVCEPKSAHPLPELVAEFEARATLVNAFIVGKYALETFRETCRIRRATDGKFFCSATWMGGTRVLSSAHCPVAPDDLIECVCGRNSRGPVYASAPVASSRAHPNYSTKSILDPVTGAFDARDVRLKQEIQCPVPFKPIEPPSVPKDLSQAKVLLASGRCYWSGFGLDNDLKNEILHSASTPATFAFSEQKETPSAPRTEWVRYYSEETIKEGESRFKTMSQAFHAIMQKTSQKLKTTKVNSPERNELESDLAITKRLSTSLQSFWSEEVERIRSQTAKDPYRENGIAPGDSGGSLLCLDARGKHFLVGISATNWQEATLLNDAAIFEWLFGLPTPPNPFGPQGEP